MSGNAASFTGTIPQHYDKGLGPNIFVDYAELLAKECSALNPTNVLELAAGTGIFSRALRRALPPETAMTVTDMNAPMLDIAEAKLAGAGNTRVHTANAMDLPLVSNLFDLVTCQFGVMFFPNKVASYREVMRVLKPGGHYVFNVWGAMAQNPFAQLTYDIGARLFPDSPPEFYKVPFHYADPDAVRADLEMAGFTLVSYERIELDKPIADPMSFAKGLIFGNPIVDEIRAMDGAAPLEVVLEIHAALHQAFGPEPLVMPLEALTFICRAPDG